MSAPSTHVPMPLEWHPAYQDRPWLLDWVEGRAPGYPRDQIVLPVLRKLRLATFDAISDAIPSMDTAVKTMTMRRERCHGFAPYVGRPFVYEWWVGIDDLGRMIAGEARIEYSGPMPFVELVAFIWDRLDEDDVRPALADQTLLGRRVVATYLGLTEWDPDEADLLCCAMRVIAARYCRHPDYRWDWAP